ncbi:MAG: hypothetical protein KGN31_01210 [Betaproteobacteria bacterium]|nr:hypothetical protein [Betaproteobacteria bacterium]
MKLLANRKWVVVGIFLSIFGLASCGGGGGGGTTSSGTPTAQSTAAVSSGTVTALGSVFVNGHEFDTNSANIVDADTGILNNSSNSALVSTGLLSPEVGMTVAVNSATGSTTLVPVASEVRITPLVRGYVDASDLTAGTITVMGQTIQVTSSTAFTDKRACATSNSCNTTNPLNYLVTGQSNLIATSGGTPGTFVIIYGYTYAASGSSQAQIVATMVSAWDETNTVFTQTFVTDNHSSAELYPFKVSGIINTTNSTIGSETLNLTATNCIVNGVTAACSSIANGSMVSARGLTAPVNNTFSPNIVIAQSGVSSINPGGSTLQVGQTVEVEGTVSSVSTPNFVVRGITIDGSLLNTALPIVGSKVELTGTVSANGTIQATSIQTDVPASLPRTIYSAPISGSSIVAGAQAASNCSSSLPAYTLTILGQTAVVDCNSEIADRTATVFQAFNINNFKTYISGLSNSSVYAVVSTYIDASSVRRVNSINIINAPTSGFVSVSGTATSATVSGTITPFTVQGVTVNYASNTLVVNVGDYVTAIGTIDTANPAEIDTNVTNGVLNVIPQSQLISNALTHLGENGNEGGINQGFRGFDH